MLHLKAECRASRGGTTSSTAEHRTIPSAKHFTLNTILLPDLRTCSWLYILETESAQPLISVHATWPFHHNMLAHWVKPLQKNDNGLLLYTYAWAWTFWMYPCVQVQERHHTASAWRQIIRRRQRTPVVLYNWMKEICMHCAVGKHVDQDYWNPENSLKCAEEGCEKELRNKSLILPRVAASHIVEGVKCPDCDKDFARHSNLSDIKIPSTRDEITTAPTQITGTSSRADQMPKHISKESTNGKDRNV